MVLFMRKKLTFEEVSRHLVIQPQFWVKWLIGGCLSFLPVANIFAFGYLYRFSMQLRQNGKIDLPEWSDWKGLFKDGLRFGLIWLIYWVFPLFLAFSIGFMFASIGLRALSYLVITSTFFVASNLFCSALYRFHMNPYFKTLLEVDYVVRMCRVGFGAYVLPILVFSGIFALALPLYGIAFFTGFLLLITHLNIHYRTFELQK